MRKIKFTCACLLIISLLLPVLSYAALPLRIVVNGERVLFPDAQPFIDASTRTQVPLRFVSEALGAKVEWDNKTRTATVKLNDKTITLVVGKKEYIVNDAKKSMDTAAMLKETRTFVPLRFVSEGLGANVNWEKEINTVYINTAEYEGGTGDEEMEIQDMYGFQVPVNTGSMLHIVQGSYDEYNTKDRALLGFAIYMNLVDGDYETQIQEVEDVLRQKIESDTVDDIMKYIRKKTSREIVLEIKDFYDDMYHIRVGSHEYGPTSVTIWYK